MSRKSNLMSLLTMIMVAMLSIVFTSCGDDDENKNLDSGQPISSSTPVNDPIGTVSLSMRNASNGKTTLGNIYINTGDNFAGANFTSLGIVNGLGNVSIIPSTGWASQVAVKPGCGYVAYTGGSFTRIYVEDYVISTSGGVIGTDIKYQEPFKGSDEEIILSNNNLEFKYNENSSKDISINNSNIIVLKAESDQSWCNVGINYFSENGEIINIYCAHNQSDIAREATVTLSTMYNRKKTIKINQLGWSMVGSGTKDNPFNVISALVYTKTLGADVESSNEIYIKGKIVKISEEFSSTYGNATFNIADDNNDSESFRAFRVLYLGNRRYTHSDKQIKLGDDVVICGKVVSFRGNTPETIQGKAYIYSLNGKTE